MRRKQFNHSPNYEKTALRLFFLMSGCRESNSDLMLPKQVYYHYTTPRFIAVTVFPWNDEALNTECFVSIAIHTKTAMEGDYFLKILDTASRTICPPAFTTPFRCSRSISLSTSSLPRSTL